MCDTFDGYIARAKDRVQTIWGNTPATYKDYHKLLADKSIDAVYIMTPEHLHHDMAIAALKAGKHVYVEKPLAHTIEEGWDIIDAKRVSLGLPRVGEIGRRDFSPQRQAHMMASAMLPANTADALTRIAAAEFVRGAGDTEVFDRRTPEHVILAGLIGLGEFDLNKITYRRVRM